MGPYLWMPFTRRGRRTGNPEGFVAGPANLPWGLTGLRSLLLGPSGLLLEPSSGDPVLGSWCFPKRFLVVTRIISLRGEGNNDFYNTLNRIQVTSNGMRVKRRCVPGRITPWVANSSKKGGSLRRSSVHDIVPPDEGEVLRKLGMNILPVTLSQGKFIENRAKVFS